MKTSDSIGNTFADKGVAADFAMSSDPHSPLDFDKRPNPSFVPYLAAVKVNKRVNSYVSTELLIRRNPGEMRTRVANRSAPTLEQVSRIRLVLIQTHAGCALSTSAGSVRLEKAGQSGDRRKLTGPPPSFKDVDAASRILTNSNPS
jgi:hypothetical protein